MGIAGPPDRSDTPFRAHAGSEVPFFDGGEHWLIEVRAVLPERLAGALGRAALARFFEHVVEAFALSPLGALALHTFDGSSGAPGGGGSTGLMALTESHLAAHGFPEAGVLCVDLFTCRPRGLGGADGAPWPALARAAFGPCEVEVRRVTRGGASVEGRA